MQLLASTETQALGKLAYSHILSVGQLDKESVQALLHLSRQMESDEKMRRVEPFLAGRSIGGLFQGHPVPSAISFQSAVQALGGRWLAPEGIVDLSQPSVGDQV